MSVLLSRRRLLAGVSAALYVLVFVALLTSGDAETGIGRFFYLAIVFAALAAGPVMGAAAGVLASSLYAATVLLNEPTPSQVLVSGTNFFRCATFVALGVLVGAVASSNRKLLSELHLLASRDPLTGLGNTRAFEEAQRRRFESGQRFELLLGDMDFLKEINDEHGHAKGDDSLRLLAGALARAIGPRDEAFRIGGDEFAVLTNADTVSSAAQIAAAVAADLTDAEHGITFGWALAPDDGENIISLYRAADDRMYERKRLGQSRSATEGPAPYDTARPARVPSWTDSIDAPPDGEEPNGR